MKVRIASRGSALALWQAEHVARRLREVRPDFDVEILIIRTTGDRITDVPLSRIGDRGLFTKEVDGVILAGEADLAVHSLKDVPTRLQAGLALGAVTRREDPRDVLVVAPGRSTKFFDLPPGSTVGTSSLRRRAQLLHLRPDLQVVDLRGNLDTRLGRVRSGDFDAAILAAAGIVRLGREDAIAERLEPPRWLPAAGQGALAVAVREGDEATADIVSSLDDHASRQATLAERTFLHRLEGGCQVPIGALGTIVGDELRLEGFLADLDGSALIAGETSGPASSAEALGRSLAQELLVRGGEAILRRIRREDPSSLPAASPP